MLTTLTIVRYPRWLGWAGFLSMAVFRFPMAVSGHPVFWKLLGCGRNGSFDVRPDWRQWGVLAVWNTAAEDLPPNPGLPPLPKLLPAWWRLFRCETCTFFLEAIEGHGTWDKQSCFGDLPRQTPYDGVIAVLTRATIRLSRLRQFWANVPAVSVKMREADGYISSIGIGEVPWVKQATFSIWKSKQAMAAFAYRGAEHNAVIRKTRAHNWYSEDMFVRFKLLFVKGTIRGENPVNGNA